MTVGHFIKQWWPAMTAILALIGASIALYRLGPLVQEGSSARQLQIQLAPTSCKRYVANYREHVWSLDDLRVVAEHTPVTCVKANTILRRHGIITGPVAK